MKKLALLLVLLTLSGILQSEEIRYVHDELVVPLRTGQSNQHRIQRMLKTGTPLTVIEVSEDGKYSQVRTQKGTTGWILSQYLINRPASKDLLKVANKQLTRLKASNKALSNQLSQLKNDYSSSQQGNAELSSNTKKLTQELDRIKTISANSLQLNNDNQRLLEENQMLKNKVKVLSTDNQRLNDTIQSDSFLNGAFAVLIGVMITLLVPRMWPKKRTEWA